ncbi:ROK family protein [Actinoplanes sp. NPDC026619]|uniref:ROK family protein n=1 Tax=Actinoplanes sp. NPDC026619 TaxID=3155798 RepID=UPI00340B9F21
MTEVPVLEIGGSHVTAALVDPSSGAVLRTVRGPVPGTAPATTILTAIAGTATRLAAPPAAIWAAAVPGPFDYAEGIGRFRDVGKFDSLDGVDVGAALCRAIAPGPAAIRFVNDAVAFALGEWAFGAARGHARAVAITLGTGVGSAFLRDGRPVTGSPEAPPEGRADLLTIDGRPLEETVSTRAILAAYRAATGGSPGGTVAEVTARAMAGDRAARAVVERAATRLGEALAPWLRRFDASVLVVGGGISAAWQLIAAPLRAAAAPALLLRSTDSETSALRGAALAARVH